MVYYIANEGMVWPRNADIIRRISASVVMSIDIVSGAAKRCNGKPLMPFVPVTGCVGVVYVVMLLCLWQEN